MRNIDLIVVIMWLYGWIGLLDYIGSAPWEILMFALYLNRYNGL